MAAGNIARAGAGAAAFVLEGTVERGGHRAGFAVGQAAASGSELSRGDPFLCASEHAGHKSAGPGTARKCNPFHAADVGVPGADASVYRAGGCARWFACVRPDASGNREGGGTVFE